MGQKGLDEVRLLLWECFDFFSTPPPPGWCKDNASPVCICHMPHTPPRAVPPPYHVLRHATYHTCGLYPPPFVGVHILSLIVCLFIYRVFPHCFQCIASLPLEPSVCLTSESVALHRVEHDNVIAPASARDNYAQLSAFPSLLSSSSIWAPLVHCPLQLLIVWLRSMSTGWLLKDRGVLDKLNCWLLKNAWVVSSSSVLLGLKSLTSPASLVLGSPGPPDILVHASFLYGTEGFCYKFLEGLGNGKTPDFCSYWLWETFEVDSPDRLLSYIISCISGQGGKLLNIGVHIDAFKSEVFQLLSCFGVSLHVQELLFEGIQEICPGLWGFICLVVYFHSPTDQGIHFIALDKGHSKSHSSFVSVEGGNLLI